NTQANQNFSSTQYRNTMHAFQPPEHSSPRNITTHLIAYSNRCSFVAQKQLFVKRFMHFNVATVYTNGPVGSICACNA
ncbi:unnamed protein product, partial [Ceratitis capitata]